MPNSLSRKKSLLATIDLGAHSCRMLIAEYDPRNKKEEVLEELSVSVPLGADVFRLGVISNASILMLCGIFRNFREKLNEYGVKNYRAIATSAVREAQNAEVLLERIRHATGIELKIFEGGDEARLDYLTVMNELPQNFGFYKKSAIIVDIGTGACQISCYKKGTLTHTETIKLGTLRMLDQIRGTVSARTIRECLIPIINKAFNELRQIAPDIKSSCIIAMGSSVRTLLCLFRQNNGQGREQLRKISREDFEQRIAETQKLSLENLLDQYDIPYDSGEAVIPCSIILENLFHITGAKTLLAPTITMKEALLHDFIRELQHQEDGFTRQIEEFVLQTALKYRSDSTYIKRVALFADKLFIQLQNLHGCQARAALLLRIAALLHKTGLFINNQGYHKHSGYIINSMELPGISPAERNIIAVTARFHRKATPSAKHAEFLALDSNERSLVMKLSALLRIACGLAESCRSVTQFKVCLNPDSVQLTPSADLAMSGFELLKQDVDWFSQVFAIPLLVR